LQPDHQSIGRTLVGTKALACINCHTLHGKSLASQPDPTTRGPDLDKVAAHLRPEYFQRWMMNPARVRPGTKMPQTIRPDGTVPIQTLASLPAGAPLDALWTYLSQGTEALPPVDDTTVWVEPTLLRPAVQRGEVLGVPRGVAMGFADGTLLFDADKLQTVAAWYGGFLKSSSGPYFGTNWSTQGSTPQRFELPVHPFSFQLQGGEWSGFALPLASDPNRATRFEGVQVGKSAVRLHYRLLVGEVSVHVTEDVRLESRPDWQGFARVLRFHGLPNGARAAVALGSGDDFQRYSTNGEPTTDAVSLAQAPLATLRSGGSLRAVRALGQGEAAWEVSDPKSPRLISAAAKAGTPVELRVDKWTSLKPSERPSAAALALLVSAAPTIDDNFDAPRQPAVPLPLVPDAAPQDDPAQVKPTRPVVNHKENSDEFAPVKAKFLRFKVTKAEQDQAPGIDELEVFGSDPAVNLGPKGKASASSVIPGYPIHQIAHINDGKLGNNNSWISNEPGAGWAQIEWPEPVEMRKVMWARDRTGVCNDRLATRYQVLVSDDGSNWTKVADDSDRMPIAASGALIAAASPGYRMEAIPLPFDGCRPSDIAFGDDGSMYVIAMTEGQIYRTRRPPAEHPTQVRWERFASGLYHPIGLAIVDGRIFVATKPEITELIDRDGDGRADEFRTVASGWGLSTGWHEYTFGLAVDRQKNLWFALNTGYFWTNPGYVNPGRWRGSVMKLSFEADRLEVVAKGCRVPNGIVRGPGGDIFYTDNQGDWIQSCKLAHVVPGRFYGHPEYKEDALPAGQYPDGRSSICLPYNLSRSSGGPVCDETAGKFGPFADQMFVGDVGYGANPGIMRVALEKVDGEYQGACFRFVDNQPHGCVRMKFGPDEQLYMASLTTGLTRMKWDGSTPLAIREVNIRPGGKGFVLKFTKPLAADTKLNPQEFRVKRYHYLYTGNYGSPEADATGVPVEQAELAADRLSIVLTLPVETYPIGMIYEINAGKLAADGGENLLHNEAWYTVHRIPK
jgi:glucose/arabinose dehydrogenase